MKKRLLILFALAICFSLGCDESSGDGPNQNDNQGGNSEKPAQEDPDNPGKDDPDVPGKDDPDVPDVPGKDDPDNPVEDPCKDIDLLVSTENCGKCGNACDKNQVCSNGKCQCDDGYSDCNGNGTCETQGECVCKEGETQPCYTGTPGTEGKGNCKGGVYHCVVDEEYGAEWDVTCDGEVVPFIYPVCSADNPKGDSDCNGIPDYLQDDDEDNYTVCKETGESNDCCDSSLQCSSPHLINPGKTADCKGNNIDDDCDGIVDEDDVACSNSGVTCLLTNRTCGNTVSTSNWSNQINTQEAALALAQAMDMCMDVVEKDSTDSGIIEYSLSHSSSSGPSSFLVSPKQVAVLNGMANVEDKVLIPARVGYNFAMLSSGIAGDAGDVQKNDEKFYTGDKVPEVYLKQHNNKLVSNSNCEGSDAKIRDSVVLHFKLRAPETAKGFSFDFRFFSREYPYFVCSTYNDFFMTIVTDEDGKPIIDIDNDGDTTDEDGNISFDEMGNAVSVNNAFFTTCAPPVCGDVDAMKTRNDETGCPNNISACTENHCGTCKDGYEELYAYYPTPYTGTGKGQENKGGGTAWLTTTAPISGGQVFNLDFYIWDTGDNSFDSSVILDNFQWRCDQTSIGTDFADPDPSHIN